MTNMAKKLVHEFGKKLVYDNINLIDGEAYSGLMIGLVAPYKDKKLVYEMTLSQDPKNYNYGCGRLSEVIGYRMTKPIDLDKVSNEEKRELLKTFKQQLQNYRMELKKLGVKNGA